MMMKREGLVLDLPNAEYHAHKSLSATGAKTLLESPAKYKYEVLDGHKQYKAAYDLGSAVHAKVLGVEDEVEVFHFESWRTKEAREARDASRDAGRVPMLAHELGPVDAMAEAVLSHGLARKILERPGNAEASLFGTTESGVPVRCRFDYLPDDGGVVADLKTTSGKATKSAFAKSAVDYGYDVARGHYLDVLELVTGRAAEMLFIVVETAAPHLVAVHQLNEEFARMGENKAREARDIYRACMSSGEWPGYPEEIGLVQAPMYAIYDYQERFGENA